MSGSNSDKVGVMYTELDFQEKKRGEKYSHEVCHFDDMKIAIF